MTDTGSMLSHLECTYCGEVFSANKINKLCSSNDCGKVLFPRYEIDSSKAKKILSNLSDRKPNMWRYKEFMPVRDEKNIVTLGEGFTPILECERLSYELGANIILKDEGLNPTSSFKARGLSSAVSKAKELGVSKFSIPSAGNAGGALAAYCARAGLEAYVFMPKDAPLANKTETIFHGANIELIDGYINDAGARSLELSKKKNLFDVST
ncbi:MAG: pyridoxal-phosphate dependent enzyme, partial [Chloroflexota bacterium]|nr:pyridoxal-phosphate dependent enzyme [Chloroflexota bacterium]